MFIGLLAVVGDDDAAVDAVGVVEVLLLPPLLLQAASASAATTIAGRHRVAAIDGTARLLCARSLGGGLAFSPVSRVPARLTGIL